MQFHSKLERDKQAHDDENVRWYTIYDLMIVIKRSILEVLAKNYNSNARIPWLE